VGKSEIVLHKLIDLLVCFVVWFTVIPLAVHEFFHSLMNQILGGSGYVYFNFIFSGYMVADVWGEPKWLVYWAGGIGTALVAGLLWWRAKVSPTKWDLDDEFVLAMVLGWQIGYSFSEIMLYYWGWSAYWIGQFIPFIAIVIPIIIYLPKVLDWLEL